MSTGLNQKTMHNNAERLKHLLADTYTLYLKTQNYHWNVTGLNFQSLHMMFEQQYTALALAADEIAERIRALGEKAPGSYREFSAMATVKEASGTETPEEMLKTLANDNENMAKHFRHIFKEMSDANDEGTMDLVTGRVSAHEKTAWMLRATLG